jgi:hypothetical protein
MTMRPEVRDDVATEQASTVEAGLVLGTTLGRQGELKEHTPRHPSMQPAARSTR